VQVVRERCCGLDVHKRTVVACVLITASDGAAQREVRTFGTMTAGLLALSDWVDECSVTHIALEVRACTGVRSSTCWRMTVGRWCWSTRSTSP